jgi:hypothetical protein
VRGVVGLDRFVGEDDPVLRGFLVINGVEECLCQRCLLVGVRCEQPEGTRGNSRGRIESSKEKRNQLVANRRCWDTRSDEYSQRATAVVIRALLVNDRVKPIVQRRNSSLETAVGQRRCSLGGTSMKSRVRGERECPRQQCGSVCHRP